MRFCSPCSVRPTALRPVFAEEVDAERVMRIAKLKWLLAGAEDGRPPWPA